MQKTFGAKQAVFGRWGHESELLFDNFLLKPDKSVSK